MPQSTSKITVYYDGACLSCVRDRRRYEKLAGSGGRDICWFDITGREQELRAQGIDPGRALGELHIRDEQQRLLSEMDAYIVLMSRVKVLKPFAWLIALPLIRPVISRIYRVQVQRRLRRDQRI